jgi:hypothetical protein
VLSWEGRAAGYEGVADATEPLPATGLGVVDVAPEVWTRDEAVAVVVAPFGGVLRDGAFVRRERGVVVDEVDVEGRVAEGLDEDLAADLGGEDGEERGVCGRGAGGVGWRGDGPVARGQRWETSVVSATGEGVLSHPLLEFCRHCGDERVSSEEDE